MFKSVPLICAFACVALACSSERKPTAVGTIGMRVPPPFVVDKPGLTEADLYGNADPLYAWTEKTLKSADLARTVANALIKQGVDLGPEPAKTVLRSIVVTRSQQVPTIEVGVALDDRDLAVRVCDLAIITVVALYARRGSRIHDGDLFKLDRCTAR